MIHYTLDLRNPSSHLFDVSLRVSRRGVDHIDLEFPSWSPGRYFIYDFARNVQELQATDGQGAVLNVEKITKSAWRIHCLNVEEVQVSYRMFGDTLSGTFSQLDDRHASVNGSSVFGYIVGRIPEPIELEIISPDGWKSYTSLKSRRRGGRRVFLAENYDVLIDSPIEIGTPITRKFIHDGIIYHIIMDIVGSDASMRTRKVLEAIDRFVADTERTVKAYTTIFGKPEFSDYYFLVNIDPSAQNGDGMEHLASTRLVINGYITNDDHYEDLVGVMSHEFFHIWNVKRMRPAELGPFVYSREHHTTLLWFAEGFTQYYGHLMLRRAGVWDDKKLFKHLVGEINMVDKSPGRAHRNLRESSFDTWFAIGVRNPLGSFSNFKNTYVNYYHKGAVVALTLDLEIRRLTGDRRSLDDVVRELYRRTYADADLSSYFLRGHGFTESDVIDAVHTVAGIEGAEFLRQAIESREDIDYGAYLGYVGLSLKRGREQKEGEETPHIFTGIVLSEPKGRSAREFPTVLNVLHDSPADRAGISAGDLLLAVDGERVDGKGWESILETRQPGNLLKITLFRGPRLVQKIVRIEERDVRPFRIDIDKSTTAHRKRSRTKWLSIR